MGFAPSGCPSSHVIDVAREPRPTSRRRRTVFSGPSSRCCSIFWALTALAVVGALLLWVFAEIGNKSIITKGPDRVPDNFGDDHVPDNPPVVGTTPLKNPEDPLIYQEQYRNFRDTCQSKEWRFGDFMSELDGKPDPTPFDGFPTTDEFNRLSITNDVRDAMALIQEIARIQAKNYCWFVKDSSQWEEIRSLVSRTKSKLAAAAANCEGSVS